MQPLERPDSIRLSAAQGWIELGNYPAANEEMEQITPHLCSHPDVLEVRWEIYACTKKWDDCRDIATALVQLAPERPQSWINLAYSIRRGTGGTLEAAQAILMDAAMRFPDESTIRYNLACYAARLGDLNAANAWLQQAFARGDAKRLKLMALDDPDLEALWQSPPEQTQS